MLKYLICAFAFILLVGCAVAVPIEAELAVGDCDYTNDEIKKVDGVMLVKQSNLAVNGVVRGYYSSGELERELRYKNGIMEGIAKWYYKSGALEQATPYENGKKEGVEKGYYENGALYYETHYQNGRLAQGFQKVYDESGKLNYRYHHRGVLARFPANATFAGCNYISDEVEEIAGVMLVKSSNLAVNGVVCRYTKNMWEPWWYETPFENGREEGIEKEYNEHGELVRETPYKNGRREGIEKTYQYGRLVSETPYKKGMANGMGKYYPTDILHPVDYYYKDGIIVERNISGDFGGLLMISEITAPTLQALASIVPLNDTEFFVLNNIDSLIQDIATGKGDTIDALAVLMDVDDDKAFGERLQANFEVIFPNADFDYQYVAHAIEMLG